MKQPEPLSPEQRLVNERQRERAIAKRLNVPLAVRNGDAPDHPTSAAYRDALAAAGVRSVQAMRAEWALTSSDTPATAPASQDARE